MGKPKRKWVDDKAKFDCNWVERVADRKDWRSRREICIPRSGSLPKYAFTEEDLETHILYSISQDEEENNNEFRTLNEKDVKIDRNVITTGASFSQLSTIHILFEETYYLDSTKHYRVLCIESPLNGSTGSSERAKHLNSLKDCVDFLWTETGGQKITDQIDQLIHPFNARFSTLEGEPLQKLKDAVHSLFANAMQILLKDPRVRKKQFLMDNFKLSVETLVLHGIYDVLMRAITGCLGYQDSKLNKNTRNLSDLQLKDLKVRQEFFKSIPNARRELSRLQSYTTPLGKLGCLKRTVSSLSCDENGTLANGKPILLSTDDLLPIFIFLVIKASVPNWFYQASLEAAIEHVKSGALFGTNSPESMMGNSSIPIFESSKEVIGGNKIVDKFFEKRTKQHFMPENVPLSISINTAPRSFHTRSNIILQNRKINLPETINKQNIVNEVPPQNWRKAVVYTSLIDEVTKSGNPMYLKQVYLQTIEERFNDHIQVFTDGSLNQFTNTAGAGILIQNENIEITVPLPQCSIMEAELIAINRAIQEIKDLASPVQQKFVILSDSRSSLQSLNLYQPSEYHHLCQSIMATISNIPADVAIQWIPSHVGIAGNEKADYLAKTATCLGPIQIQMTSLSSYLGKISSSNSEAIRTGNEADVKKYLDHKPEEDNDCLMTLCHPLCSCDKCEQLQQQGNWDKPTLHLASIYGHVSVLEVLLTNEVNINVTDYRGFTSLHLASLRGHHNAVLLLLHFHADWNIVDNDGNTPLHLGCANGHKDVVNALLYFTSQKVHPMPICVNASNDAGETPLHPGFSMGL
ncbi:Ankyrin repeat domain-containing protein 27 [Nymphon striatum]|nr:Ankyrin repeat domain-containing protein 27 [Nymphon striatum]KAG1652077.1 Ankyrin repeat domain-containing protein 27 [Nymphon striatum]